MLYSKSFKLNKHNMFAQQIAEDCCSYWQTLGAFLSESFLFLPSKQLKLTNGLLMSYYGYILYFIRY